MREDGSLPIDKRAEAHGVTLRFVSEERSPTTLDGSKPSVWLGRDPSCDIVFAEALGIVSRRHAEIRLGEDQLTITDNNSFNGTMVNDRRITSTTTLTHGDQIRLGTGGPMLKVDAPMLAGVAGHAGNDQPKTIVLGPSTPQHHVPDRAQLVMSPSFDGKDSLVIGRSASSDIRLDALQISKQHARLAKNAADVFIEDLDSTNGVYVNGVSITRRTLIRPDDTIQIGAFVIQVDASAHINIFDTRSKTRIDAVDVTKEVKNRAGGGSIRLLDQVSLSIRPNEFVGLLGPSGAGKSTLMDAMNGMRPATSGSILINKLDLYQHLASLKQSIGYVPQDDIIHRELSVYRTLYYVAKLRLSSDVTADEIENIIDEVLDVTGLSERRNVAISQLSGGQRKRVSIAVELITKPSVIFLDEPTSGLDPATEEKIMKLFRQIAESGRTIILTTHAMENVKLFDKIVVMMRGKLVFYGAPAEALTHVGAASFKDLYDKLEQPIGERVKQNRGGIHEITEQVAEEWKQKFTRTPQYKQNVYDPLVNIGGAPGQAVSTSHRLGLFGAIRQSITLSRRYAEVLLRDKLNLLILFAQAPIIALLTYVVMGENETRDFAYFVLSLVAVWFGTSVAAREIIRERAVYDRERMVNVGLVPYVFSKLFVLSIIVGIQCLLLFVPLKVLDLTATMPMPGEMLGLPQLWVMLLTAIVGIAIGLLISARVKTSELATSLVPLILIPQILFSGLIGVPSGLNRMVGLIMPAAWAFDTMKRYSTLDTLEEEGADPNSKIGGHGYYKYLETENKRIIEDSKQKIDQYKRDATKKIDDFEAGLKRGENPPKPKLDDPPKPADAKQLDKKEMSNYVTFLNPWMNKSLNQIVLVLMFVLLTIATLIVLRSQDAT